MMPIMTLEKLSDKYNAYGFDTIEVIAFNYDGEGTAVCFADGYLTLFGKGDLEEILCPSCGDDMKDHLIYGLKRAEQGKSKAKR